MPVPRPDKRGYYGPYGGRYVPETLVAALDELGRAYDEARRDPAFKTRLKGLLADYVGRPTPLYHARRLSARLGRGIRVYLKREDLAHTGAHKINNAIGQALLALRMRRRRVVAETGAGQHGVATATACALLDLSCEVYMGTEDMARQAPNVHRMELLGARVVPVEAGERTLKEATSEAIRDWLASHRNTHYLIGSTVGPHPYPRIVRDFQSVIGREARRQVLRAEGRLPDLLVACVGGGSNALGLFAPFHGDTGVDMVGVEGGGRGPAPGDNAASLATGSPGVLHGSRSYLLQDEDGQVLVTHSISAGLDYPGVGPEHAWYKHSGRARYEGVTDEAALEAFHLLCRLEGILPALESSHAVAWLLAHARKLKRGSLVVLNLSGRGDKDLATVRGRP